MSQLYDIQGIASMLQSGIGAVPFYTPHHSTAYKHKHCADQDRDDGDADLDKDVFGRIGLHRVAEKLAADNVEQAV